MIYGRLWIVGMLLAFLSAACGADRHDRTLIVSIEPQRYLLERIAGEGWTVRSMLDKGSDPENFDPSMSVLKAAAGSRAYFSIGQMAFEEEILSKLQAGNDDMTVIQTSAGIVPIKGHVHADGTSHGGEMDPHVWSSVRNSKIIAANMRDAMIDLDPANKEAYESNYASVIAELDSLDNVISDRLAPLKGKSFMVWHPSLSYFARDYGLHQMTLGSEHKEISASAFRRQIDKARRGGSQVFFIDAAIDRQRAEEVAAQVGAKCKVINLTSNDWLDNLDDVSREIASAYQSLSGK